jgi:hypothetical protein
MKIRLVSMLLRHTVAVTNLTYLLHSKIKINIFYVLSFFCVCVCARTCTQSYNYLFLHPVQKLHSVPSPLPYYKGCVFNLIIRKFTQNKISDKHICAPFTNGAQCQGTGHTALGMALCVCVCEKWW